MGRKLLKKVVILINGKGGSGKDTLCEITKEEFEALSISSITPIKEIAKLHGWDGVKNKRGRRFLSDLKNAFMEFNDLPNCYIMQEYFRFLKDSRYDILFIHVREPDEIVRLKQNISELCDCYTLLVSSPKTEGRIFDNSADDSVDDFNYDIEFMNNIMEVDALGDLWIPFLLDFFRKRGLLVSVE